uniref:Uncharacterized protein n=1 Tax=Physcomitrium patens TaxID=3218 RepID=A0A7I4BC92_PHYPA
MSELPSSSNGGEGRVVARISVKDRLGPLPSSFKRRDRSAERPNYRRGRKSSKFAKATPTDMSDGSKPAEKRIPVRDRLGPLPAEDQSFDTKKYQVHLINRQDKVWKLHPDKDGLSQQPESKEVEPNLTSLASQDFKSVKAPFPLASLPPSQPFNVEQHRKAWTWVWW